jgi:hypothetical protein
MSDLPADPTVLPTPSNTVAPTVSSAAPAGEPPAVSTGPDLDAIERDLADVELALARLDSGDYWRDEVTGAELPDELLAARPTARQVAPGA